MFSPRWVCCGSVHLPGYSARLLRGSVNLTLGGPIQSPLMECSFPLEPRQRGQELCVREIKKAECERIKLYFGPAGFTRLLIVLIVLLLKNLLRKFEAFLGHVGECSESSARFPETGLALSRGPREFYLVWPRFQGPYHESLVFTLISGYLQTHFKERGQADSPTRFRKNFRLPCFLNKIPESSRSLHKSP